MKAPLSFALAALCLGGGVAAADPALFGSVEVTAGGGHDTNMLLSIAPDAVTHAPPLGGWFGRAAPRLAGAVAAGGGGLAASGAPRHPRSGPARGVPPATG